MGRNLLKCNLNARKMLVIHRIYAYLLYLACFCGSFGRACDLEGIFVTLQLVLFL